MVQLPLFIKTLLYSIKFWQDATYEIHYMKQMKIRKPKQYEITVTLLPHKILRLQLLGYLYLYGCFTTATDSHL